MPVKPIPIAVAAALVVVSSTMLASPGQTTQQPGQMTQGHVQIDNRGREEAIPVELNLDKPLRMQIVNDETTGPVLVRAGRLAWEYQTVIIPSAEDPATRLNALGTAGWETTGIAVGQAGGARLLLKRPRQP
jgi:hypothetical protein